MDEIKLIEVKEDILADNNQVAEKLREELRNQRTFLLNLMSSPGAGKTTTILKTIEALQDRWKFGVIEADIDSTVDARRITAQGTAAVQLKTGGLCHVDASMVKEGLDGLDLDKTDVVIIENVGNLVCPAEFDTGAVINVMVLSVPEGDDKPLKYPLMFTVCDVLLVNKIDYLGLSDFQMQALKERVFNLNPRIKIFEISAKSGEGMNSWLDWLNQQVIRFFGT